MKCAGSEALSDPNSSINGDGDSSEDVDELFDEQIRNDLEVISTTTRRSMFWLLHSLKYGLTIFSPSFARLKGPQIQ
jgi:hypothetical protein